MVSFATLSDIIMTWHCEIKLTSGSPHSRLKHKLTNFNTSCTIRYYIFILGLPLSMQSGLLFIFLHYYIYFILPTRGIPTWTYVTKIGVGRNKTQCLNNSFLRFCFVNHLLNLLSDTFSLVKIEKNLFYYEEQTISSEFIINIIPNKSGYCLILRLYSLIVTYWFLYSKKILQRVFIRYIGLALYLTISLTLYSFTTECVKKDML